MKREKASNVHNERELRTMWRAFYLPIKCCLMRKVSRMLCFVFLLFFCISKFVRNSHELNMHVNVLIHLRQRTQDPYQRLFSFCLSLSKSDQKFVLCHSFFFLNIFNSVQLCSQSQLQLQLPLRSRSMSWKRKILNTKWR